MQPYTSGTWMNSITVPDEMWATTNKLEWTGTVNIFLIFYWFRFWPCLRNRYIILRRHPIFHPNWCTRGGVITFHDASGAAQLLVLYYFRLSILWCYITNTGPMMLFALEWTASWFQKKWGRPRMNSNKPELWIFYDLFLPTCITSSSAVAKRPRDASCLSL